MMQDAMNSERKTQSGFTLIEVMVAMIISALLLALAATAARGYLADQRAAADGAQLRKVAQAAVFYTEDNFGVVSSSASTGAFNAAFSVADMIAQGYISRFEAKGQTYMENSVGQRYSVYTERQGNNDLILVVLTDSNADLSKTTLVKMARGASRGGGFGDAGKYLGLSNTWEIADPTSNGLPAPSGRVAVLRHVREVPTP